MSAFFGSLAVVLLVALTFEAQLTTVTAEKCTTPKGKSLAKGETAQENGLVCSCVGQNPDAVCLEDDSYSDVQGDPADTPDEPSVRAGVRAYWQKIKPQKWEKRRKFAAKIKARKAAKMAKIVQSYKDKRQKKRERLLKKQEKELKKSQQG